jgi:hypothetical protein
MILFEELIFIIFDLLDLSDFKSISFDDCI